MEDDNFNDDNFNEDPYRSETFQTLTAFGYNYILAEIAYQAAPIKTVEGVINYIESNPSLEKRVLEEIQAKELLAKTEAESEQEYLNVQRQSFEEEAYLQMPNVGYIDPELKHELLLMGYEDYLVIASL